MTYKWRGRTMTEVIVAVTFVGFLTGFVAVLCIGNYYRALRAMERQKQKRIARLSGHGGNGIVGAESPGSTASSSHVGDEQQRLLGGQNVHSGGGPRRRNGMEDNGETLLLDLNDGPRGAPHVSSI
mmetsp:Transcript_37378/g.57986  ORF Transcript_37378/g.57986 Transcript_37378/m.57986 type:complete len:126 (+) Transcript_37378:117-494(+)